MCAYDFFVSNIYFHHITVLNFHFRQRRHFHFSKYYLYSKCLNLKILKAEYEWLSNNFSIFFLFNKVFVWNLWVVNTNKTSKRKIKISKICSRYLKKNYLLQIWYKRYLLKSTKKVHWKKSETIVCSWNNENSDELTWKPYR